MDNAKEASQNSAVGQLAVPTQQPQLTIVRVGNGYTINPPYYTDENTKVAKLLDEMLDIVKEYFVDKS